MQRRLLVALAVIVMVPVGRLVGRHLDLDDGRAATSSPARDEVLSRARVFVPEGVQAGAGLPPGDEISCTYVPKPHHGTTPKFDCRLENGVVLKVKYGGSTEIHSEVAATRLMSALGFAADEMAIVRRVRCRGCPPWPFHLKRVADWFLAAPLVDHLGHPSTTRDFDWVSIEQKFPAQAIDDDIEGWQWSELAQIDASKGGASRAEVDALRLINVVLADWDNKSENQRLVCLGRPADSEEKSPCPLPLVMLQDLGGTFGPRKLNLANWQSTQVWHHAAGCTVSMASLPYHGGTFVPATISEAGRRLLAARLSALSETDVRAIFLQANFPDPTTGNMTGDVTPWVRAFQEKVRAIADRPPCASLP